MVSALLLPVPIGRLLPKNNAPCYNDCSKNPLFGADRQQYRWVYNGFMIYEE